MSQCPVAQALVIGGEMRENGCSVTFRLPKQNYRDIERIIEFDFVRATEAAALNSLRWLGRGDKEAADAAACDAMRGMFDLMNICGEVVIGEGIKDEAPGIFKGEQLGTWMPGAPEFDIAIDPIDGTTNISKGAPNSISCIAAASPEEGVKVALRDVPSFYMSKLAYGPRVIDYMKKRGDSLRLGSADCGDSRHRRARARETGPGCGGDDAGPAAAQGNRRANSRRRARRCA